MSQGIKLSEKASSERRAREVEFNRRANLCEYGHTNIQRLEHIGTAFGPNYACLTCGVGWYMSHCWSCHSGIVDQRDPANAPC